jgi:hexosaminidase
MRHDRMDSPSAIRGLVLACLLVLLRVGGAQAATVTPLAAAGYSALPAPQQVALTGADFAIGPAWRIALDAGVAADDVALETLRDGAAQRHGLRLRQDGDGPAITLAIRERAVEIGAAADHDRALLARDAYRLELHADGIRITANAGPGLFYGVGTLLQLITPHQGGWRLPVGEITDWPDLQLRAIMWDDAHHLERVAALQRAIETAASFKINGFVLKLDGHFQFRSAPALVEPHALSPEEYQALTDYGLRHHVQVIPYLDAPAHLAFILKHPAYAGLRAFPGSNYELDLLDPDSLKLLCGMYQDLLDANKGVGWFYLSTDESYYVGMSDNAGHSEAARQRELGSAGKVLAGFLGQAGGWLREHGRTPVFWGEHPIAAGDAASCPPFLVSGCTSPELNAAFTERGIRQMIFTSAEGEERLFPDYAIAPDRLLLHPRKDEGGARVADAIAAIQGDDARRHGDLLGAVVAGWADSGLHPETFWLGYVAISAAAWNPAATDAASASADFHRLFHGLDAPAAARIYQLLSTQAQFWQDSWERAPSTSRSGIWGNSHTIFAARKPANDETLPLPLLPADGPLAGDPRWATAQVRRLELARHYLDENDELQALLHQHLRGATLNRHTWEVFLSIAALCRQNLELILGIARMHELVAESAQAAGDGKAALAVARLDQALAIADAIKRARDGVLADTTATWYRTWQPRVASANGRTFLHQVDDVKDHLPDRTVGMEYLVLRELLLPFGEWVGRIEVERYALAKQSGASPRSGTFRWRDP